MFDFLCWIFTFLFGGLIGWVLAGWLSQRDCASSDGEKIIEKKVDNPEHLALINKLQAENKEIAVLKTKLSGYESTKEQVDESVHLIKIKELESQIEALESSNQEEATIDNPEHIKRITELEAEIAKYQASESKSEVKPTTTGKTSSNDGVSTVDKAKAKASGYRIKKLNGKDDFTIVLGIGPKISSLIHSSNIHTFKELSESAIEDIQKILDEAGPKFKLAVPETWPAQAKLAADNKWEELRAWQDELDGGKLT